MKYWPKRRDDRWWVRVKLNGQRYEFYDYQTLGGALLASFVLTGIDAASYLIERQSQKSKS